MVNVLSKFYNEGQDKKINKSNLLYWNAIKIFKVQILAPMGANFITPLYFSNKVPQCEFLSF